MKNLKTLMILLAFVLVGGTMAACDNGGGGHEDADTDVQEDDVTIDDVHPDDVTPDDVTPDDVVTDDVVTDDVVTDDVVTDDVVTDDVVTDDVVTDDVPTDELPPCSPITIACGDTASGTTTGLASTMDDFVCSGRPVDWHETGGEVVYELTTATAGVVTIALSYADTVDVDVYVLTGACDVGTCLTYGDGGTVFRNEAGATYYLVVDTYRDTPGDFDITVTCGAATEICDDGIDNNDDDYIDCDDAECYMYPPCFEPDCGNGTDDDGDGDVDCADDDCFGAAACMGGAGVVGDPCDSQDDCASGQCATETVQGFPGGYCMIYAGDSSCTELVCPTGSTCLELGWFAGYPPAGCFADCSSASCRDGYACDDTADSTCWPACTVNTQCVETTYCDTETGYCAIPPELCTGGVDEDGDGLIDCLDPDCIFGTDCLPTPTALAGGETCAAAAALTMPSGERGTVAVTGTTTGAANDLTPGCQSTDSMDVVYSFTLTAAAHVMIDLLGGSASPSLTDTVVYLRSDCAAADLGCSDDYDSLYHSFIDMPSLAAGTYYIIVDGYSSAVGDYRLAVNFSNP